MAPYLKHYDSTDLNLNWKNLTFGHKRFQAFQLTQNTMATVICEKQTLGKIHPNSRYPCRSQSLAISNITEELYCRCRYIIKFGKMEFNCLYQSLPFSSCNLLSPLRQQIYCRVGWTLTWHREQHWLSEKLPQKKSSQKFTYMLPSLWHRKNLN